MENLEEEDCSECETGESLDRKSSMAKPRNNRTHAVASAETTQAHFHSKTIAENY